MERRGKRAGIVRETIIPNIHQITVSTSAFHDIGNSDNISVGYCNAQSIKKKECILYDYMEKQKLNGLVITEMWLKDNKENDKIWMDCSLLNFR